MSLTTHAFRKHPQRVVWRTRVGATLVTLLIMGMVVVALAPAASAKCGNIDTALISCPDGANPTLEIIKLVLKVLIGLVGVTAVGALVFAGILYSSASGDTSQVQKAKTMIQNTVIGLVLFGGMMLIGNWMIPGGMFGGSITYSGSGNEGSIEVPDDIGTDSTSSTTNSSNSNSQSIISSGTFNEASSFSIGTWNTRYGNSSLGSKVKSLMDGNADILGLQEVHNESQRNDLDRIACSGCAYDRKVIHGAGSKGADPILWRRSKFTLISDGVSYMSSPSGYSVRYATWVQLQEKTTGRKLFVINTHTPPGVESGSSWNNSRPSMVSAYKTHMRNLASLVSSKKATGASVFVVGDFNVDFRDDGKQCKVDLWPCRTLGKGQGVYAAWHYNNLAGISKSQGTFSNDSRLIDYAMVPTRTDVKVKSTKVLGGNASGWNGSDHKPSLTTVAFGQRPASAAPTSSTGAGMIYYSVPAAVRTVLER